LYELELPLDSSCTPRRSNGGDETPITLLTLTSAGLHGVGRPLVETLHHQLTRT